MRPVDRREWPKESGVRVDFSDYKKARRWLYERIGSYCSYCGRRLESAAVEHIRPKKPGGVLHPDRLKDWENFLLACVNCNSYKSDNDVKLDDYFWPDQDNTMRAIEYHDSGSVSVPKALLNTPDEARARNTLVLVGLNYVPKLDPIGNVPTPQSDPSATDTRWENRRKVWLQAEDARSDLLANPSETIKKYVLNAVKDSGYWPIWFKHLADIADMRDRLLALIPGTVDSCFDATGNLKPRPGGRL